MIDNDKLEQLHTVVRRRHARLSKSPREDE